MFKAGNIVVFVGATDPNGDEPIKYGDVLRIKGAYHEKCSQLIDIGLKLPEDATFTVCPCCGIGITEAPNKWLGWSKMFRMASGIECLNFEIKEAIAAPTPKKTFVINNEDDFKRAMEYGKTYLKAPIKYYFTDNFNFDE